MAPMICSFGASTAQCYLSSSTQVTAETGAGTGVGSWATAACSSNRASGEADATWIGAMRRHIHGADRVDSAKLS